MDFSNNEEIAKYLKGKYDFTIEEKWYFKIPYIGKRIKKKRKFKKYLSQKHDLFKDMEKIVRERIKQDNSNPFYDEFLKDSEGISNFDMSKRIYREVKFEED